MTVNIMGVFDLETTGTDVETDRIVTAYIAALERDGTIAWEQSWIVNPGIPIPAEASAVHGYTDADVADGMDPAQAVAEIALNLQRILPTHPVAVFNAAYDLTLLDREVRRHEVGIVGDIDGVGGLWFETAPILDPLVLDKALDPYRRGKRTLTATAAHYGIPDGGNAHNAAADAIMAGRIAFAQLEDPRLDTATPHMIHGWTRTWRRRQQESFADYLRSRGTDPADVRPEWPIVPPPGTEENHHG